MSGRFVCGMRRFDKHKVNTEQPSNAALHQENQKSLSELIRLREEQDRGTFQPIIKEETAIVQMVVPVKQDAVVYTPWKTPSTS
jgi:hypothetical protein